MDSLKTTVPAGLVGLLLVGGAVLQFAGPSEYAIFCWLGAALVGALGVALSSPRWGLIAAAAVCLVASAYLYGLKAMPSEGPALCSVNETIDCVSINDSPYSVIFAGTPLELPITLPGMGYFLGLAAAALFPPSRVPRLWQAAALFGLFNVAVSLYLGTALVTEAKVCVFCITIYLGNLITLWAAFRGASEAGLSVFDGLPQLLTSRSFATITGVFAVVVVAGKLTLPAEAPEGPTVTADTEASELDVATLATYYAPPAGEVALDGTEPTLGPADAPYVLLEYADYACPHCAQASAELKHLLTKHDNVALKFKAFPLTGECNPGLQPSGRPGRCLAALAAECAGQQGLFWEVQADLFTNQRALAQNDFPPDDLLYVARRHGVDAEAFRTCLEDEATAAALVEDAMGGVKAGLQGTPTFFLKGITPDGGWVLVNGPIHRAFELVLAHEKGAALPAATR